jgi:hypothetical protein
MRVGRRRFIQHTAAAASIPALTYFVLPFSGAPVRARLQSYPLAQRLPSDGCGGSDLMLEIYGWKRDDLANAYPKPTASVGVSRSWRASWR